MPKFNTPYDFIRHEGIVFTEPSMTDQSQAPDCDINRIFKRYAQTGLLMSPGQHDLETLQFGDATLLPDYETALELVRNVETEFSDLPSNVRAEFDHDPAALLAALQDPAQKEKLQKLGLIPAEHNPSKVELDAAKATQKQELNNAKSS